MLWFRLNLQVQWSAVGVWWRCTGGWNIHLDWDQTFRLKFVSSRVLWTNPDVKWSVGVRSYSNRISGVAECSAQHEDGGGRGVSLAPGAAGCTLRFVQKAVRFCSNVLNHWMYHWSFDINIFGTQLWLSNCQQLFVWLLYFYRAGGDEVAPTAAGINAD